MKEPCCVCGRKESYSSPRSLLSLVLPSNFTLNFRWTMNIKNPNFKSYTCAETPLVLNLSLNSSWQLLSTQRSNKCNQILETSATAAITQVRCQHIMFLLCEWPADFYKVDLKTCTKLTTDKTMMCSWFPVIFRLNRDHYFIKRHVCKWLV